MVLLIDPYAHQLLSMADIRLVNRVASDLIESVDDPAELITAIRVSYRRGMAAEALKTHVRRYLRRAG